VRRPGFFNDKANDNNEKEAAKRKGVPKRKVVWPDRGCETQPRAARVSVASRLTRSLSGQTVLHRRSIRATLAPWPRALLRKNSLSGQKPPLMQTASSPLLI
jgi:hypothetical protein